MKTEINYQETWPECRLCGETIQLPSGEILSNIAYANLGGICNKCLYKIQGKQCFNLIMKGDTDK